MNRSVGTILVLSGFVFAVAGCDATSDKSRGDILAEDSTLNLAILGATADSLSAPTDTPLSSTNPSPAVEQAQVEPVAAPPIARVSQGSRSTPAVKLSSTRANRSTAKSRRVTTRRVATQRAASPATRRRSSTKTSTAPVTTSRVARVESPVAPTTTMRSTARVPAGWELTFQTENSVCTNTTAIGDKFTVHLVDDVTGPIGVVIPKGAVATGVVSKVQKKGNRSDIDVDIESLAYGGRTYPVSSDVTYTTTRKVRAIRSNTGKVVAGAGIGAAAGGVIGRDAKSAIIGAAAGALGGAVLANQSKSYDECVPEGGRITTKLTEPLVLRSTD